MFSIVDHCQTHHPLYQERFTGDASITPWFEWGTGRNRIFKGTQRGLSSLTIIRLFDW